jgi:hypothetical protein
VINARWRGNRCDATSGDPAIDAVIAILPISEFSLYYHSYYGRTGALLLNQCIRGEIIGGPMTFQVDGKQYVSVASGNSLFVFALRE